MLHDEKICREHIKTTLLKPIHLCRMTLDKIYISVAGQ